MKIDTINRKLQSESGASLLVAILFFVMCTVVGAVVLTAATASAGRAGTVGSDADPERYALASAAQVIQKEWNREVSDDGAAQSAGNRTDTEAVNLAEASEEGSSVLSADRLDSLRIQMARLVYRHYRQQESSLPEEMGTADWVALVTRLGTSYRVSTSAQGMQASDGAFEIHLQDSEETRVYAAMEMDAFFHVRIALFCDKEAYDNGQGQVLYLNCPVQNISVRSTNTLQNQSEDARVTWEPVTISNVAAQEESR